MANNPRKEIKELMYKYWGGRCAYCLKRLKKTKITGDHFIPKSLSGTSSKYNYVPSCSNCNFKKDNKPPDKFCSDSQRKHISRYFNCLFARDMFFANKRAESRPDIAKMHLVQSYSNYLMTMMRFKHGANIYQITDFSFKKD